MERAEPVGVSAVLRKEGGCDESPPILRWGEIAVEANEVVGGRCADAISDHEGRAALRLRWHPLGERQLHFVVALPRLPVDHRLERRDLQIALPLLDVRDVS